jgi:hypothetical protein
MHELRNAILAGETAGAKSPTAEPNRRRPSADGLAGVAIAREERRSADQRGEERHRDRIARAILIFRGKKLLVPVINLSSGGLMIEGEVAPTIGESVGVEVEGVGRLQGIVRWIRGGRIGVDVGEGTFRLD